MFSVRQSSGFRLAASGIAAILLIQGCSNSFLARFAPPGIVKYEDIAGDKPPNPVIEETIREYRADTKAKFPILSQTPTAGPAPAKPNSNVRDATMTELVESREKLAQELQNDEAAIEADRKEVDALPGKGEALAEKLDEDTIAAQSERKNDLSQKP